MLKNLEYIKQILINPGKFFEKVDSQSFWELYKFWFFLSMISSIFFILMGIALLPGLTLIGIVNPLLDIVFSGWLSNWLYSGFLFRMSLGLGMFWFIVPALIGFLLSITVGFLSSVIYAFLLHITAYLFGCRGFKKTMTIVIMASSPLRILGSVFLLYWLGWLYFLVLEIIGLSKLHKISKLKSFIIVMIPTTILFLIYMLLLVLYSLAALMSGNIGI